MSTANDNRLQFARFLLFTLDSVAIGHAIFELEGRTVCGVVHDSDISDLGGGQLNAMGSRNGRTAFVVKAVVDHPKGDKQLPVLEVDFLGAEAVQAACDCEILETIDGEPFDCPEAAGLPGEPDDG